MATDAPISTAAAPRGARGSDARLEPAYALIESGGAKLLSLDVFDTLVFRTVPEPTDAFPLIGEALRRAGGLRSHVGAGAFGRLRAAAEARARVRSTGARAGGAEVDLLDVYAELEAVLVPGFSAERAIVVELQVEQGLLAPDLEVCALVDFAREREVPVVCVSDTYLSESELRRHVLRCLPEGDRPFARVFASSDYRRGKGSGLFPTVLRELGVSAAETVHVGDNLEADVRVPTGLGIAAVPFERRPKALQSALDREHAFRDVGAVPPSAQDHGLSALRGKVLHRRERAELPATVRGHWSYGAAHLGPAFAGFADWVVQRAGEEGLDTAHCLMREGELLVPMIDAAAAAAGSPLRAQPLWLSRQVCARASLFEGSREELERLLERRRRPTVAGLLTTLGLDPGDAPSLRPHLHSRLVERRLVSLVLDELSSDARLRGVVVGTSQALRQRLLGSLAEVLPTGVDRLLLVDLGWGATIQDLLRRLLAEAGVPCDLLGLYMVTHAGVADRLLDGTAAEGFLGSVGIPRGSVDTLVRSPEILEQVCMPDHGSQLDLAADGTPVLPQTQTLTRQDVERDAAQKGILAFGRLWLDYRTVVGDRLAPLTAGAQGQLLSMLARATAAPTPEEATLFASWLHDDNFGSSEQAAMTAGPSVRALRHLDARALLAVPMSELYWPFGLATLHDEQLARAAELVSLDVVDWRAFGSEAETGMVELFADTGGGYSPHAHVARTEVRRNRLGLSYARAMVQGDRIRSVRLDPAAAPCILRLDWVALHCWRSGEPEPQTTLVEAAAIPDRLELVGAVWLDPGVILNHGGDPQLVFAVEREVADDVFQVEVELAYAILPLPRRLEFERTDGRAAGARRTAKVVEARTGLPVMGIARRLKALARRLGNA